MNKNIVIIVLSCLLLISIFYVLSLHGSQNNLKDQLNAQTQVVDSIRSQLVKERALAEDQYRVAEAAYERARQAEDSAKEKNK